MEMLAACIMIFNVMAQQKLTVSEHQQVEAAYHQIAPECKGLIEKAQKDAQKEQKKSK